MDAQKETTELLTETLNRLSRNHDLSILDVRLTIAKPDSRSLSYHVMNKQKKVQELKLKEALNIESGIKGVLKETLIRSTLNRCMDYFSKEAKSPVSTIELRIYTKTEQIEPTGYLFSSGKPVRPVSMDEIFKII